MFEAFAAEIEKAAAPQLTPEQQKRIDDVAKMSFFNKVERRFTRLGEADSATPGAEMDKARTTIDGEVQYLKKRYNVTPHLVGSMPLGVNLPGDVDVDFVVPIRSPQKFKQVVKRLENNPRYVNSPYNKPGMNHYVFQREAQGPGDYPVDVGVSFGEPAKQFTAQRKAMKQVADQIPEETKQNIVAKKMLMKHTPFDIGKKGKRYKAWKKDLNRALNPLGGTIELGRKPAPPELAKVGEVIPVNTPEGAQQLEQFAKRRDVYGHRTHHADVILDKGKIMSATSALKQGQLKSFEAGFGGGHKEVTHGDVMTKDQLDRLQAAVLQQNPNEDAVGAVIDESGYGANYHGAMQEFIRRRKTPIKQFLQSGAVEDPDKFRRRHLSVPKMSPHVFVTKNGVLDAPQYGDVSMLVRTHRAKPSPFTNLISREHVVTPLRPMEERKVNVKSGIIIAKRERVEELNKKHPNYRYVVEEDIPEGVRDQVFLPTRSVGEIGRRWLPAILRGEAKLRPR